MKKWITLVFLLPLCIPLSAVSACDYGGQILTEDPPSILYGDADAQSFELAERYFLFRRSYDENLEKGNHHANLRLIKRMLPEFYGDVRERRFYEARTDAVIKWRESTGMPMACSRVGFDIRADTGYVLAELNNLTFENITAFKVRFDVMDVKGEVTGKGKDHYFAVGTNIPPGEDEIFIWRVDDMTEPGMLGNFKVIELVFESGERVRYDS